MDSERQVVQVDVPSPLADLAADVLWRTDPSAVGIEEHPGGVVRLTADAQDLGPLEDLPAGSVVRLVNVDDDGYLDAWREWATPMRAGRRVVLQPAWLPTTEVRSDDIVVTLDAGRAFGSGSHPSTRLAIEAMEGRVPDGGRVLDVGTGSGVLAIVASHLGAASVVGIDPDPEATRAASANARANGVADRILVSATPIEEIQGTFEMVLANIGVAVLIELAPHLCRCTAPGGLLVLSGLLIEHGDRVVAHCRGFSEVARPTAEGWCAPVLRAPA